MNNEKGSVTILFVVFITLVIAFVGMAVDFGYSMLEDLRLSNAIDAATLAAAQELDNTAEATAVAHSYLQAHGIDIKDVSITFEDNDQSIILESTKNVTNHFIKVIGFNTTEINARSKATVGALTKVHGGIKPFGVEEFDVNETNLGTQFTLKAGSKKDDTYGPGNFGALALGGTGASNLRANAIYGYDGPIEIGQEIETEPGNMASIINPIKQSLSSDTTEFEDYGVNSLPEDSIRLWVVPMVNTLDVNGRKSVVVKGFALFFIEDIGKQSGKTSITGRFVKGVIPGEIGSSQESYGLLAAKLVE